MLNLQDSAEEFW